MLQARTEQGLVRESNEDVAAATLLPDGSALLVVADGVGGYPGGEVASLTALDSVLGQLRAQPPIDPEAGLRDAFEEAHVRVQALQTGAHAWMSTTLVVALVRGARAWLGNVGDSRGYLVTSEGAQRLTRDHSWVEEQIRAGRLRADDPAALEQRNLITRSVGGDDRVDADVYGPIELPDPSVLLLSTDGLHGVLDDEAIAKVVAESGGSYLDDLVEAVLAAGAPDNVGIALLFHHTSGGDGPR